MADLQALSQLRHIRCLAWSRPWPVGTVPIRYIRKPSACYEVDNPVIAPTLSLLGQNTPGQPLRITGKYTWPFHTLVESLIMTGQFRTMQSADALHSLATRASTRACRQVSSRCRISLSYHGPCKKKYEQHKPLKRHKLPVYHQARSFSHLASTPPGLNVIGKCHYVSSTRPKFSLRRSCRRAVHSMEAGQDRP